MVVSHVGSTIMPHVVMADISAWGEVRTPIYDRLDVFRGRACVCDFSCSSVTDLLCVWTRTFGCTLSIIDLRHWTDPLFQLQGIQGWSFNNYTTTWRMRTIHHMPESD